eukprot:NODE_1430_length_1143_cov_358.623162.p1 GENE.NODE_1430_length_1143_cov_358.623162~~NODE_1430_length_1143_cov_358.623162.p1  ORF type:complete len:339 (+),score=91.05 NODE_1430_length_1143_cov_358.623162:136-1017(+)
MSRLSSNSTVDDVLGPGTGRGSDDPLMSQRSSRRGAAGSTQAPMAMRPTSSLSNLQERRMQWPFPPSSGPGSSKCAPYSRKWSRVHDELPTNTQRQHVSRDSVEVEGMQSMPAGGFHELQGGMVLHGTGSPMAELCARSGQVAASPATPPQIMLPKAKDGALPEIAASSECGSPTRGRQLDSGGALPVIRRTSSLEVGGLELGIGTWALAYHEAQGARRTALKLLCGTGIVSERELSDDLTVVSEEHIEECISIAMEMLVMWPPKHGLPSQAEAQAFFEERLAALYMRKVPPF